MIDLKSSAIALAGLVVTGTPALLHAATVKPALTQWAEELADAIPNGQFKVIETGHFAALESPELLLPVLKDFLAHNRGSH